jgi:hypothetical protein
LGGSLKSHDITGSGTSRLNLASLNSWIAALSNQSVMLNCRIPCLSQSYISERTKTNRVLSPSTPAKNPTLVGLTRVGRSLNFEVQPATVRVKADRLD